LSLSKNEDINDMINLEIIQYINDNKENKWRLKLREKDFVDITTQLNPITGEYYFDIPVKDNLNTKKSEENITTLHIYSNIIATNGEDIPTNIETTTSIR
jgi:hypothetical protein